VPLNIPRSGVPVRCFQLGVCSSFALTLCNDNPNGQRLMTIRNPPDSNHRLSLRHTQFN